MKKQMGFFIGCGLLALSSTFSQAGVESSGGADRWVPTPAWFMGPTYDAPIRTCVKAASDFGVDTATAIATLKQAFQKWEKYMLDKELQTLPVNYVGTHLFYRSHLQILDACNGTEDLRVYLGDKDETVRKALAQYNKPFGFVELTQEPTETQAGKGFLYIAKSSEIQPAPNWTTGNHLMGLMLHEVGHILGCGHLEGTIMGPDIGKYLSYSNETPSELARIDGYRELRPCLECAAQYRGDATSNGTVDAPEVFSILFGKRPTGPITQFRVHKERTTDENGHHGGDYNLPRGALVLTDASGEHAIHFHSMSIISSSNVDVPLFLRADGGYATSTISSFKGVIEREDGVRLPVFINVNLGSAFEILLDDNHQYPQLLFSGSIED